MAYSQVPAGSERIRLRRVAKRVAERRFAEGHFERMPDFVAELVKTARQRPCQHNWCNIVDDDSRRGNSSSVKLWRRCGSLRIGR
jgi:hypothetical protein